MTAAEQAFLTMVKMTNHRDGIVALGVGGGHVHYDTVMVNNPLIIARTFHYVPDNFPIVASTFATLVEERPELREHYDRAKEAWEAGQ